jgi:hypothetical protein
VTIDLCHVDADASPSWGLFSRSIAGAEHVWFFDGPRRRINRSLRFGPPPIPWALRKRRALVHGGGWGIGGVGQLAELSASAIAVDLLVYRAEELVRAHDRHDCYLLPPSWFPWDSSEMFPPLGFPQPDETIRFEHRSDYPPFYDLLRTACGVVSKPGGGTLIDCLNAATPLVLLEPCGAHERANAELWLSLGLAMTIEDWRKRGFDLDALGPLAERLLIERERAPDYAHRWRSDGARAATA